MPSLTDIAREILRNAEIIDGAASQQEGATALDVGEARTALLDATHKLNLQAQTPEAYLFQQMWSVTDTFILRTIYTLKLPAHVPLTGEISYETLATKAGMPVPHLTRLTRYAITLGFFTEPTPNHVSHSPLSRLLATSADARDAMGMILEELGPATHAFPEALAKWGDSGEPNQTAWNVANATEKGIYEFLALKENSERGRRFGGAMRFFAGSGGSYVSDLLAAFPWTAPQHDHPGFVVVDVGGGVGGMSVKLAEHTSHVKFVVQDKASVVEEGRRGVPAELGGRVVFQEHDFFKEQGVRADVYFFRWIFHNWSDVYCVRILRALVPALKVGARVLVYEHVVEEGTEVGLSRKRERYLDLFMLCAYNSRERTEGEWKKLLAAADKRFGFRGVRTVPGAALSLVEAVWEG